MRACVQLAGSASVRVCMCVRALLEPIKITNGKMGRLRVLVEKNTGTGAFAWI